MSASIIFYASNSINSVANHKYFIVQIAVVWSKIVCAAQVRDEVLHGMLNELFVSVILFAIT